MFNPKVFGADRSANGGALVAALQVSAAPTRLYSVTVFNTGVDGYLQLHDAASAPANGEVPKICLKSVGDTAVSVDFQDGRIFTNGVYVCKSDTSDTKTLSSAEFIIDATYRLT